MWRSQRVLPFTIFLTSSSILHSFCVQYLACTHVFTPAFFSLTPCFGTTRLTCLARSYTHFISMYKCHSSSCLFDTVPPTFPVFPCSSRVAKILRPLTAPSVLACLVRGFLIFVTSFPCSTLIDC